MKTILVPTDFSEQAAYALDAAYQLARKKNATLLLVHVLEFPMEDTDTPVHKISSAPYEYLRKAKEEAMLKLQSLADQKGMDQVPVACRVLVGNPYLSITRELTREKADMVVMGSKGASGIKELLLGSNAERMVRFARCPVLVIKEDMNFDQVRHIVFATSLHHQEKQVMEKLMEFQQLTGAHLHLLRVNTRANFMDDPHVRQLQQEWVTKHHLINFSLHTFSDQSEEDGIIHFANQINATVIAMATHGRRGIMHLLAGSVAENVVNHAGKAIWTMSISE